MRDEPAILPWFCASSLAGIEVPPREWLVDDLVPAKTVTLVNGDGAVGKSLLFLQLAVARETGGYWIGRAIKPGSVLYLTAEDDQDEVHRRLADICAAHDLDLADLEDLRVASLAGMDAILAAPQGKSSLLKPTPVFASLEALISQLMHEPLIILDTLADIFGGEENQRIQARQFIGLLRGLCVRFRATVIILAHPSLSGMASGTGSSGSTGWNNSVRSRLYFERIKAADGEDDPDLRVLRTVKANYSRAGQEIRLRWQNGVFKPAVSGDNFEALAAQSKAERVFMQLLAAFKDEGRYVSHHQNAPTYAPSGFAKDSRAEGVKVRGFVDAMSRLFAAGRIAVGQSDGPPSKRRDIIVAKVQE